MTNKGSRQLIAKEIELGFLRVPASIKKYFPKEKNKMICLINNRKKELLYNPKYGRITGLVEYFRKNKAKPKDLINFEKTEEYTKLTFQKVEDKEKEKISIDISEAEDIINYSELPTQTKGNIVEQRIAELILLYGQGKLNVYKPVNDIEGIDLIVVKSGVFQPIFIQVKSKFKLRNNSFQIGVRARNFNIHHAFFVVGAYFDPKSIDIFDYLIFISSIDYKEKTVLVRKETKNAMYVLDARLTPESNSKFTPYVVRKDNLVNKIFEKFEEIEKYIK